MNPEREGKKKASAEEMKKASHQMAVGILHRLNIVLKIAKIYEPNNFILMRQVRLLFNLIQNAISETREACFSVRQTTLFFNNIRLRYGFSNYHVFKFILAELKKKEIGIMSFLPGLTEDEMKDFLLLMAKMEGKTARPFEEFLTEVKSRGMAHVALEKELPTEKMPQKEKYATKVYFLGILHLKESFEADKREEKISLNTTRRLMQSIFNHIVENESFVYGLTNIKNFDEYTLNHSINVCFLSIALGRRLGLDRNELIDLGISAFFHDFGKLETPKEILDKPSKLDEEERRIIEKHPFHGAGKLVQLREFKRLPLRAINVALEHHVKEDLSGYPRYYKKKATNLYSKIVKIADYFDAITTKRVYRKKVFTRDEALSLMLEQSGSEFHPLLLQAFVHMMGSYPVGTFAVLDSGEFGVVVETRSEVEYTFRPKVKLITDKEGNKIDGEVVDLAEKAPDSQKYKRTILKSLNPDKYGIKISEYFLAKAV